MCGFLHIKKLIQPVQTGLDEQCGYGYMYVSRYLIHLLGAQKFILHKSSNRLALFVYVGAHG